MWARLTTLLTVMVLLCLDVASAQVREIPEFAVFVFPTRPEVSIKLSKSSTGKPVRGKMVSLTATEVVVDTGSLSRRDRERGELGQRIGFDRIESLRSTDGRFQFQPEEDFKEIGKRVVAAYASVRIQNDADPLIVEAVPGTLPGSLPGSYPGAMAKPGAGASLPGSVAPQKIAGGEGADADNREEMPIKTPPKSTGPALGNRGFGERAGLPKVKKPELESNSGGEAEVMEESPESAVEEPGSTITGAQEILFCSNCTKEIPSTAIKSGFCPHCKVAFANISIPPVTTTKNPFDKGPAMAQAGAPAGGAFAATNATPVANPAAAPVANNTGTVVIQGGGFTFDSVPNWAKGGLFVLFVLVAYHMLFNR